MRGAEAGSKNIPVFQYDLSPRIYRPSDICFVEVRSGPNGNYGYTARSIIGDLLSKNLHCLELTWLRSEPGINPPYVASAQWIKIDSFLMAAGGLKSESKAKI
jgi:hypothetical protein